jgi:glutathione S-transferase
VYHREKAGRPIRVVWTLEELGQPYELVVMDSEVGKGPEHLTRHPLGRVPVIEDDEGFVFESAAICLHLADLHPEAGLIPPPGSHERALVYQWAVFTPAEMEQPLIEAAMQAERDPERSARARARFDATVAAVENALDGREQIVGDQFTVADVLLSSVLGFTRKTGTWEELPETLQAYVERQEQRPARQRALEAIQSTAPA